MDATTRAALRVSFEAALGGTPTTVRHVLGQAVEEVPRDTAEHRRSLRLVKLHALLDHPLTPDGERAAAEAAIQRLTSR